jgi:2-methylisocitrate lyase-like PEP mutase family enzyme
MISGYPRNAAIRRTGGGSYRGSSQQDQCCGRVERLLRLPYRRAHRCAHGLDEAGANILFIETRESEAERERIGTCLDAPLLANMLEGGTPILSEERLVGLGCRVAIFPASGFLTAGAALRKVYEELRNKGSTEDFTGEIYSFTDSAV